MHQHRDTTKRNYYAVWKIFNEFFVQLEVKPSVWEDRLTLFVGYLIDQKKQSSTVKSYISAIKAVLKMNGVRVSEDMYLLSSLTKACHLKNDQIHTRLPIKKSMLSVLLKFARVHFESINQPFLSCLYRTLISTMYFGLFRISEMTKGSHPVLAKDVHIGTNKKKFLFILRTSKMHGRNMAPQLVKITSKDKKDKNHKKHESHGSCRHKNIDGLPCPYSLLCQYAKLCGNYSSDTEPFFFFADKSPVTPWQFGIVLKTILCKAGFDHKFYGLHSLQMGRSSDLFKLGLSVETIKQLGRWRSNTVFCYIRG